MNEVLIKAVELTVPKFKEKDSTSAYINDKILKIQIKKNKTLTKMHH